MQSTALQDWILSGSDNYETTTDQNETNITLVEKKYLTMRPDIGKKQQHL